MGSLTNEYENLANERESHVGDKGQKMLITWQNVEM